MARHPWLAPLLLVVALGAVTACDGPWSSTAAEHAPGPGQIPSPANEPVRFLADSSSSIGLQLDREAAAEFTRRTGIPVDVVAAPASTDDRLAQTQLYLMAQSPDFDLYEIDVIWPGLLANDLLDLTPYISASQLDAYFPAGIRNNTVNGKLVALPYFTDVGLLYYRTDLLAKYGLDAPPTTWDQLEAGAEKIQAGEREPSGRAGNPDFWGFVWQGDAYEGLTCDALEWQVSHGGGTIVNDQGEVSLDNPAVTEALAMAKGWVNSISPPAVLGYQENQSLGAWRAGNAAFMRNWSTAWARSNNPDTQTGRPSAVAGKFSVAPLPQGSGPDSRHAATLGGWQLAVSRYTRRPQEAVQFLLFLASREHQKERAIKGSYLPSLRDLYNDQEVLAANPYFRDISAVFANAVARPSTVTADAYREVSTAYFTTVHAILTGEVQPEAAIPNLQKQLQAILQTR